MPDAVKQSRKREREDETTSSGSQDSSEKLKQLYHAMKAACTANNFTEAVNLCSEALNEEHVSKSMRTKFLLARSSIYSQMDNASSLAIKDAKEAILLAPTHAMGYLRAAKAFHKGGHEAKAMQALAKAGTLATDTMSELSAYIKNLQQKWSVPHIETLPYEILVDIFGYLETKDLFSCTTTCRHWKDISTSNPGIWNSSLTLRGTLKKVESKWKSFTKFTRGGRITSLTIDLTPDTKSSSSDLRKTWQLTTLRDTFPCDSLINFDYTGHEHSIDKQIWSCVTLCNKLKILKWKIDKSNRERHSHGASNHVRWQIKGTPLAQCRLEDIHIDDPSIIIIDEAFTQMFSQVKRMHLMMYIPWIRQYQILTEARKTVQEAHLTGTFYHLRINGEIEPVYSEAELELTKKHESIAMEEITSCGTIWSPANVLAYHFNSAFNIPLAMPKITRIINRGGLFNWNDLRAWQETLLHLEFNFDDCADTFTEVDGMQHRLPVCESLILTFNSEIIMTQIWKSMKLEDEAVRVLPKLKHLKIVGHPTLTGGVVVNLIRFRIAAGTPIETLHIYQSEQIDHESVAWLRRTVPDFFYSTSTVGRPFLQEN